MPLSFKKLISFFTGSLLGVMLFFGAYMGVPTLLAVEDQGAGGETAAKKETGAGPNAGAGTGTNTGTKISEARCTTELPIFLAKEKKSFLAFMNAHFKNPAPNSELLPVALDRLKDYQTGLTMKLDSYRTLAASQSSAIATIDQCRRAVEQDQATAQQVFLDFVQQTTYSKRSTALTEKLGSINGRLKSLNDILAQLDGYFTAFSDKLPGFIPTCLKE